MGTKSTSPVCSSCRVLAHTPFHDCGTEVLLNSFPGKQYLHFEKDEFLFHELQSAEGVFCLSTGKVKVSKRGMDQKEYITRLAKPGYLLGLSLFTSTVYANSAVALEKASACFIHKDEFIPFVKNNPDVLIQIMKHLCYEIEVIEQKISGMTHKSSRQRLAETLLMLRSTYGLDKHNFLKVMLPIQDLANFVRIGESIMCRLLNNLVSEQIISVQGERIQLLNIDKLYEMARARPKAETSL